MGRRSVIKERFSKKYRHPTLDSKITLKRLNAVSVFVFCFETTFYSFFHSINESMCCLLSMSSVNLLLKQEARCMTKARRLGVSTPVLYSVDPVLHTLTFEYVEGPSVKDILLEFGSHGIIEERLDDIALQIGDAIGKLHDGGLIHGDLTTSNMLLKSGTNQLVSSLFFFFHLVLEISRCLYLTFYD